MVRAPALVAVLLLLAGCAASADPPPARKLDRVEAPETSFPGEEHAEPRSAPERSAAPVSSAPPGPPAAMTPGLELGTVAAWSWTSWEGTCPCIPLRFEVTDVPAGAWLEVMVAWDGTKVPDVGLRLRGPDGAVLDADRGFDERRVQVFSPALGTYAAELEGPGDVRLRAILKTLDGPSGPDRLPNLVTMRPQDFHIGSCDTVEAFEQGAERCLRFGNGIGNTGYGPLQVRLDFAESAQSPAGQGQFVQEVLQQDGTMLAHEVATANLHPTHAHWHYDGAVAYALFALDPATGLRKEEVTSHNKAGFCLLDWDQMDSRDTEPWTQDRAATDCLIPWTNGWTMGISPGWYDFYVSALTDQYVDVEGVPDGLYEFVSTADGSATLAEWDEADNAASMVLQLDGDDVDVVEARAYYQVQASDQG